ncbi:heavy metal translocating P-type ATPase [Haloferula sp. BvORR071]|uniref:heavy metal translocating P-type ATPase n=1 Tax=Haloferula sp. BvORR071 TaxID=1396141 RepID=UPI000696C693|nr:heavy metal translocating P-type ATPase [Haloferula sp. BvORR071]
MHDHNRDHAHGEDHDHGHSEPGWPWLLGSAIICGVATLTGVLLQRTDAPPQLALGLYALAYLSGGWEAALDSLSNLRRFRLDIHFLMLAVAVGAAIIGAWWEGAALLFLFSLSGALEAMAMARTEREIRSLFQEAPKQALLASPDGSTRQIAVAELYPGAIVRILPGEQFPADARVTGGESAADESSLTGESLPVDKAPGDHLFGGTLNTWGVLEASVTRAPGDSAHARIIHLIREAQASKAPSQRFTDRFGTAYTLGILGFSFLMFLWWHLGAGLPAFYGATPESSAFYRAMTLLVVCSPCALVISIPSAILAGIAAGARRGILFRGGVALENLATINRLAVDKTGTLTKGELELVSCESSPPGREDELLALAAALSANSTHPLSRAIVKESLRRKLPAPGEVSGFESISGQGLEGSIGGRIVRQGRRAMFSGDAWLSALPDPQPGLTEVLVQAGEDLRGRILLRDAPRSEAAPLIRRLAEEQIRVTMLTGDRPESAELIAKELGLAEFRAGLHPEDKVKAIRDWRAAGERVAMAGDGVNDAPSLAAADISIGMGLRGSDAVLEQADIVLTHDRLERIVDALSLSRRCRRIIRENLAISLGVVVMLGLAALGSRLALPLGVLGHEGSTVVVVLNSLRLLLR